MLRKFRIRLNDKEYLVEMEELTPGAASQPAPAQQPAQETAPAAQAPASEPAAAPEPAPAAAPAAGPGAGVEVAAPMPGTILDILKTAGDQVKENEPVLVLEAMKMENQIVSPKDGTLTSVCVSKGESVDVSAVLFTVD